MSMSIYWKPVEPYIDSIDDCAFRDLLIKKFGDSFALGDHELAWLEAVEDCGHKGARELREAIWKHGTIQVDIKG